MPISYKKQPATLQEKVDKALQLSYQIHDVGDSEFLRGFIMELLEKAFRKLPVKPAGSGNAEFHDAYDANIEIEDTNTWLDNIKRGIE